MDKIVHTQKKSVYRLRIVFSSFPKKEDKNTSCYMSIKIGQEGG